MLPFKIFSTLMVNEVLFGLIFLTLNWPYVWQFLDLCNWQFQPHDWFFYVRGKFGLIPFDPQLTLCLIFFSLFISNFFSIFFLLISERLAESLRTIPTSPTVQSAVFLCFRVILIRMSPQRTCSSHVFTNPEFSFYNCFFFEKQLSVR